MENFMDILEKIGDVCVIILGIICLIFTITEGLEFYYLLLGIGMIAFGVYDIFRIRKKRRRKALKR